MVGGSVGYAHPATFCDPAGLFAHDLTYTYSHDALLPDPRGVLYLVVWDQRYRCRTCLRRLRMPVFAGSWPNMFLKGQPRMEYICTYGHGTLKVPGSGTHRLQEPGLAAA